MIRGAEKKSEMFFLLAMTSVRILRTYNGFFHHGETPLSPIRSFESPPPPEAGHFNFFLEGLQTIAKQ